MGGKRTGLILKDSDVEARCGSAVKVQKQASANLTPETKLRSLTDRILKLCKSSPSVSIGIANRGSTQTI